MITQPPVPSLSEPGHGPHRVQVRPLPHIRMVRVPHRHVDAVHQAVRRDDGIDWWGGGPSTRHDRASRWRHDALGLASESAAASRRRRRREHRSKPATSRVAPRPGETVGSHRAADSASLGFSSRPAAVGPSRRPLRERQGGRRTGTTPATTPIHRLSSRSSGQFHPRFGALGGQDRAVFAAVSGAFHAHYPAVCIYVTTQGKGPYALSNH